MTKSHGEHEHGEPGVPAADPEFTGSDEAKGSVDLNATVTLSGEALAALLEQVKNTRGAGTAREQELPEGQVPGDARNDAQPEAQTDTRSGGFDVPDKT